MNTITDSVKKQVLLIKKGKRMRLSGKDAIGHDPVNGNPMYKHIPFYITFNDQTKLASGLFYNLKCQFKLEKR